jgi:hypothetical protein
MTTLTIHIFAALCLCHAGISLETDNIDVVQAASQLGHHVERSRLKGGNCDLMLITFLFTRMQDKRTEITPTPIFENMSAFYESAMKQGVDVTVLYDELPIDILMTANKRFQFEQVSLEDYEALEGVNGARYKIADSLLHRHPEWKYVFLVDPFETIVAGDPCLDVADDRLYTAIEPNLIRSYAGEDSALSTQFREMGGRYQQWWQGASPNGDWKTFSDGIVGGHRDVMLTFTGEMLRVLTDPDVIERNKKTGVNVNAAAFNYLMQVVLKPKIKVKTGRPVHYCYWGFEAARKLGPPEHECYMSERVGDHTGFWFVHK